MATGVMSIRAKLVCNYVQEQQDGGKVLHFHAVYDGSEENKSFATSTPGAYLNMTVDPGTPASEEGGFFKQGDVFYVDFTRAPK